MYERFTLHKGVKRCHTIQFPRALIKWVLKNALHPAHFSIHNGDTAPSLEIPQELALDPFYDSAISSKVEAGERWRSGKGYEIWWHTTQMSNLRIWMDYLLSFSEGQHLRAKIKCTRNMIRSISVL